MSYPLIEIVNSTNHVISGEISYMTVFCSSHYFSAKPHSAWKAQKRGICPIIEISALVKTPRGTFIAKPYISIGTTHNLFELVQTAENMFRVIRLRNSTVKKAAIINSYNQTFLSQK